MTSRPEYRYLEPPPPPDYGALGHGIRWALLFTAVAFLLILAAGFLVSRAIGAAP